MKKFVILILMGIFVFASDISNVYAATALTDGTNVATGDVTIANTPTFARQTAVITFTTSNNVSVGFDSSAATSAENYTVGAAHKSGNTAYGMDSTGGPTYYKARTAVGTAPTYADMGPPAASATGAAIWTGWTAQ